jgi:hypothetical protein
MLTSCQVCGGGPLPMNMNACAGCIAEAKTYWPGRVKELEQEKYQLWSSMQAVAERCEANARLADHPRDKTRHETVAIMARQALARCRPN